LPHIKYLIVAFEIRQVNELNHPRKNYINIIDVACQ